MERERKDDLMNLWSIWSNLLRLGGSGTAATAPVWVGEGTAALTLRGGANWAQEGGGGS